MKVTIDEYSCSLAIKEDLIRKMMEVREEMKQEKIAFELQCEKFRKVIKKLKDRLGDSMGQCPSRMGNQGFSQLEQSPLRPERKEGCHQGQILCRQRKRVQGVQGLVEIEYYMQIKLNGLRRQLKIGKVL